MADPFDGIPPEFAADFQAVQRRRAIADLIAQRSMQPIQAAPSQGRFAVPITGLQVLGQLGSALSAHKAQQEGDKSYADLGAKYQQRMGDEINKYNQTRNGTPAQAGTPALDPVQTPGTTGDPRAAITSAVMNPYLRNNPLVQADMKKIEPNWQVHKQFDDKTGLEKNVLVDLNNPQSTMDFGGQQAVKMHFADTGGEITPVSPYSTAPLQKTVDPNRVASPADIEKMAQGIASGQLAPITSFGMRNPMGASIMSRVMDINPGYDAKNFTTQTKAEKDFATGKQGNTVRSFNVAISHLNTLDKLSDALNNGDIKIINQIGNQVASQTGQPAPTEFNAAKKIVGDEIVKAIIGSGGGVADREEATKTIDAANSPAQLKGVINTYKELMVGQIKGLQKQHEGATGKSNFQEKYLSPEVRAMMTPTAKSGMPQAGTIQDGYRFKGGNPADKNSWEKM